MPTVGVVEQRLGFIGAPRVRLVRNDLVVVDQNVVHYSPGGFYAVFASEEKIFSVHGVAQQFAHLPRTCKQIFVPHQVQRGDGCRASHRVARVGVTVPPHDPRRIQEGLRDARACGNPTGTYPFPVISSYYADKPL